MFRRQWRLLKAAAYLGLSSLVLGGARVCVRAGWRPRPLLAGALEIANELSRAALLSWREVKRPDAAPRRRLPKRSSRG